MSRSTRDVARSVGVVAVVALGLGLAACSGDSEPGAAHSEPNSASQTGSPYPIELSAEDEAIVRAEPAVQRFFRTKDDAMQAPAKFKHHSFDEVAIGAAETYLKKWHGEAGEQGLHQVGTTELASVEAEEVDLTSKPEATPPEVPLVEFLVCFDVTDLDIVTKAGESAVSPNRKDRGVANLGVANYEYPDGPWLVAYIKFPEGKSC